VVCGEAMGKGRGLYVHVFQFYATFILIFSPFPHDHVALVTLHPSACSRSFRVERVCDRILIKQIKYQVLWEVVTF